MKMNGQGGKMVKVKRKFAYGKVLLLSRIWTWMDFHFFPCGGCRGRRANYRGYFAWIPDSDSLSMSGRWPNSCLFWLYTFLSSCQFRLFWWPYYVMDIRKGYVSFAAYNLDTINIYLMKTRKLQISSFWNWEMTKFLCSHGFPLNFGRPIR